MQFGDGSFPLDAAITTKGVEMREFLFLFESLSAALALPSDSGRELDETTVARQRRVVLLMSAG